MKMAMPPSHLQTAQDEEKGRKLVATKDILMGQITHSEAPICVAYHVDDTPGSGHANMIEVFQGLNETQKGKLLSLQPVHAVPTDTNTYLMEQNERQRKSRDLRT